MVGGPHHPKDQTGGRQFPEANWPAGLASLNDSVKIQGRARELAQQVKVFATGLVTSAPSPGSTVKAEDQLLKIDL